MLVGFNTGFCGEFDAFLNRFKLCADWTGVGNVDGQVYYPDSMNLDPQGYPLNSNVKVGSPADGAGNTSLNFIRTNFPGAPLWPAAAQGIWYPSGTYQLLWDGAGSIAADFDASGSSGIAGGIQFTVAASGAGIRFTVTPPVNNVRLFGPSSSLTTAQMRSLYENDGEIFNPDFIAKFTGFNCVRFMDWLSTNANTVTNISQRPLPDNYSWNERVRTLGQNAGIVPYEVCVALCLKLGAHGYFNMPFESDVAYASAAANVIFNGTTDGLGKVWAGLSSNPSLECYVEYGNEPWNVGEARPSGTYNIGTLGYAAYPAMKRAFNSGAGGCDFTGSIADDGNGTTSTLTITAVSAGSIRTVVATQGSFNRLFFDDGTEVGTGGVYLQTQLSGTTNGAGTYQILKPGINVTSQALHQGGEFSAWLQNAIRLGVLMGAAFKAVNPVQTVRVLNPQSINGTQALYMMQAHASDYGGNASDWTGQAGDNVNMDAVAIAPYFLSAIPGTDTLDQFFTQANIDCDAALANYVPLNYQAIHNNGFNLRLIAYEGGHEYIGRSAQGTKTLFGQAQRDSRMGDIYSRYLTQMAADNLELFIHYTGCYGFSDVTTNDSGNFGLLENIVQDVSTAPAPKYTALVNFIASQSNSQAKVHPNLMLRARLFH